MSYTKEQRHEYYLKNKDKWKIYSGDTAKMNATKLQWRKGNPEKALLAGVKSRCKQFGIYYDIDVSDIQIPEKCPYLGVTLEMSHGKGKLPNSPSLDRIDPTKGYIKGNVQVISDLANRMKQNATVEQLVIFAHSILEIYD